MPLKKVCFNYILPKKHKKTKKKRCIQTNLLSVSILYTLIWSIKKIKYTLIVKDPK